MLLSKGEIEAILRKTIPNVSDKDIQKAAQSLVEATGQWKEVDLAGALGAELSIQCRDICAIGDAHQKGLRIKAFIENK